MSFPRPRQRCTCNDMKTHSRSNTIKRSEGIQCIVHACHAAASASQFRAQCEMGAANTCRGSNDVAVLRRWRKVYSRRSEVCRTFACSVDVRLVRAKAWRCRRKESISMLDLARHSLVHAVCSKTTSHTNTQTHTHTQPHTHTHPQPHTQTQPQPQRPQPQPHTAHGPHI